MRYVPLFVEIKAEACEDQGEERHEDSDGDGAAVGGAAGVGVDERYVFPHAQTWWRETLRSVRGSVEKDARKMDQMSKIRIVGDDDDDGNDGDDNEEEGDEQSGMQLPVDKDDSRNDRVDNDRSDCNNLVEDNHEMMTTGMLSTEK